VLHNTGLITVIPLPFVEIFYLIPLRPCYEKKMHYFRTYRQWRRGHKSKI